ncbi:MAG: DUF255 domain-containing protein [Desulfobacterales bacterium]
MKANRLIGEKSPYLLQHAHNPVDWHPWNEEAFATAAAENKPIFLSIGYATCHCCHVMEKESFENEEAARHLNETFVRIKEDADADKADRMVRAFAGTVGRQPSAFTFFLCGLDFALRPGQELVDPILGKTDAPR